MSDHPPRGERPVAYRYLEELDRTPKAALSPALLVAALFYHSIAEAWAEAGLGRPGEDPVHPRGADVRAEEIADGMLRDFASRHSLSKHTRAQATRAILAQRLLRKPRGHRMRAAKLVSRDWFDAALELLKITVAAEGADPEVIESWQGRAAAVRAGEQEPLEAAPPGGGAGSHGGAADERMPGAGLPNEPPPRRRRRRRGRGGRGRGDGGPERGVGRRGDPDRAGAAWDREPRSEGGEPDADAGRGLPPPPEF
jgi:hypothetical protein